MTGRGRIPGRAAVTGGGALLSLLAFALSPVRAQAPADAFYVASDAAPAEVFEVDPATGETVLVGTLLYASEAVAQEPTADLAAPGLIYYVEGGGGDRLAYFDPVTGDNLELGPLSLTIAPGLTFTRTAPCTAWPAAPATSTRSIRSA